MANKIPRVPVREQDQKVRATNFEEVCYGYNVEEAQLEASRCLNCKNPRCVGACPVSVKIPQFISEVAAGNFARAAEIIAEDSSLPAVCGRVCPQETQCEGSCILCIKGESVAIGKLERFVADWSRENGGVKPAVAPANGHKVAVIGSGPAGLACASDLAKLGYDVTIFEALHRPGGVLEYGIPEFRLPKDKVVAAEIASVKALGVKIETNVIAGRTVTIDSLLDEEGFDAVFVGSGAGLPRFMNIPGEHYNGVFSANEFLTRNNLMKAYRDDYVTLGLVYCSEGFAFEKTRSSLLVYPILSANAPKTLEQTVLVNLITFSSHLKFSDMNIVFSSASRVLGSFLS